METITSLQNSKVKKWTALHKKKERDLTGLFLIEGEHLIQEALKEGIVETIITDTSCHKLDQQVKDMKRVILLDGVQDPGNLGTLIRTAVSFSFNCVYVSEETVDLYNDKTIRSTQGALFHIPVIRCNLNDVVKELQHDHFTIVATSLEESKTISEIKPVSRMGFIFGNEGQGVSKQLQEAANERLRIEMHGFESLNVAVAGGIVMYEYRGK